MILYNLEYNGQYNFKNGSGVYAILNELNNKKYIGSTSNLRKRYRQHLRDLNSNKHHNKYLQNSYNKYGQKYFKFIILEKCENIKSTMIVIEQKYIDSDGDYNIAKIVECPTKSYYTGHIISEEHREIVRTSNRNRIWSEESLRKKSEYSKNSEHNKKQRKVVLQYSIDDVFIREFTSISEAALFIGKINNRVSIKRCCQGKSKTAYQFKWKYKNDKQINIQ